MEGGNGRRIRVGWRSGLIGGRVVFRLEEGEEGSGAGQVGKRPIKEDRDRSKSNGTGKKRDGVQRRKEREDGVMCEEPKGGQVGPIS